MRKINNPELQISMQSVIFFFSAEALELGIKLFSGF